MRVFDALRAGDFDLLDCRVGGYKGKVITPAGVLVHHTASAAGSGDLPSLSTCVHGRPDLPGPLCQVLIGRAGTVACITDGYANHAGDGHWPGITSGNQQLIGIELENNGTGEPWSLGLLAVAARVAARLCDAFGVELVLGHKEWAPGRKIDPSFDMDAFRTAVDSIQHPQPSPVAPEEDDVLFYRTEHNDLYAVSLQAGGFRKHHITGAEWTVLGPANEPKLLPTTSTALAGIPDA